MPSRFDRSAAWIQPPAATTRHVSPIGRWEMSVAPPPPAFAGLVREYVGWWEDMATPFVRRELPTDEAPLIIAFGAPFRLYVPGDTARFDDVGSFVTGAYDRHQLVGSTGPSGGVQVNLTLLGMRRLLGQPLDALTNRAVALDAVFGRDAGALADAVQEAPSWDARFALVTRLLAARFDASREVPPAVEHAWRRITRSGGLVAIGEVADEVGWSAKHLIDRVRHEIGLAPKALARVVRFGRAIRGIKSGRVRRLADLSLACGYYDQAHLTRDVRAFAGVTPGELLASLLPDRGGFATGASSDQDR
jgi:AraC-like DNA-binding protein